MTAENEGGTPAAEKQRPFRFPKAFRLRKGKEFDRVFEEGKRVSDGRILLVYAPNGLPHSRLGILAGRKIGNAVTRNRAKRVYREAFRLGRDTLPRGYDFVVVPRPQDEERTLAQARESLEALAQKAVGE
ncbi:MAG: ribonuclease P protein component [Planctomycetota bacterium]|jgi:ribonuclease P protein component